MNEREQFEEFAKREFSAINLSKIKNGDYEVDRYQTAWEAWQAALRQQGKHEGMVLVPVEPTFNQWQEGSLMLKCHNDTPHMESPVRKDVAICIYKAMIAAKP